MYVRNAVPDFATSCSGVRVGRYEGPAGMPDENYAHKHVDQADLPRPRATHDAPEGRRGYAGDAVPRLDGDISGRVRGRHPDERANLQK